MWKPLQWQRRPAQAGIYNIEIIYPDGQTHLLTGCEGPPVVGAEIEPSWFVTAFAADRRFVAGYPVDYEAAVADSPPRGDHRETTVE